MADEIQSRFCPVVRLHRDDQFKKTIETINLIDRLAGEGLPSVVETPEGQIPAPGPDDGRMQRRVPGADEALDERQ